MSTKVLSPKPVRPKSRPSLKFARKARSTAPRKATAASARASVAENEGLDWDMRIVNPPRGKIITLMATVIEVRKQTIPSIESLIEHEVA